MYSLCEPKVYGKLVIVVLTLYSTVTVYMHHLLQHSLTAFFQQCIYGGHMILRVNSYCFLKQR
jgi:hypothetical protein